MILSSIGNRLANLGIGTLIGLSSIFVANNVNAAETLILNYGGFRAPVSVSELSTFAETGELSSSLKRYLNLANQDPAELQMALNHTVKADALRLNRALRSIPGEAILDQASQYLHTPYRRSDREALRGAIMTSALENNQVTMIEVLENYPTDEAHLDVERFVENYQGIEPFIRRIEPFLSILSDFQL